MGDVRIDLEGLLADRIVILDGAMGTAVQARRLTEEQFRGERFAEHPRDLRGDIDVLNLTQPDVVADVHRGYLEAGADIVSTNTFTATPVSQADYGLAELVENARIDHASEFLAEAMERAIRSASDAAACAARESLASTFSWERNARETVSVWESTLTSSRR